MDGREVGWEGLDGMRLDGEGGWIEGRLDGREARWEGDTGKTSSFISPLQFSL